MCTRLPPPTRTPAKVQPCPELQRSPSCGYGLGRLTEGNGKACCSGSFPAACQSLLASPAFLCCRLTCLTKALVSLADNEETW